MICPGCCNQRLSAVFWLGNGSFSRYPKELEEAGFFVFGAREIQVLEGGEGEPSNWPVAIIQVLRKSNQSLKWIWKI